MSQTDEKSEQTANMERLNEQPSACGPGCNCHTGPSAKTRWLVGAIIVAIAGLLVVRAVMKGDSSPTPRRDAAFASPATPRTAADSAARAPVEKPPAADAAALPETVAGASKDKPDDRAAGCGEQIGSLGDLALKAQDKDGVFVFLAGQDAARNREIAAVMEKSVATLRGRNISMGVFTLKEGSSEYANLARQVPPPGVMAMVKGRGVSAVSDDVTEPKLIQAFVAASGVGGGCCPGGASASGCK